MDYITGKLKNRDVFGQPFGLTFRGAGSYKTWFGSVATTLLNILLLFYAAVLFIKVYTNRATALNVDKQWFDIQNPKENGFVPGITTDENGKKSKEPANAFNLGVGFMYSDMDETIGTWEFSYLDEKKRFYNKKDNKFTSEVTKQIKNAPIEKCGDGESFKTWSSTFKTATDATNDEDLTPAAQQERIARAEKMREDWTF
jgi:hypothetical protein